MITKKGGRPGFRPRTLVVIVAAAGLLALAGGPGGNARTQTIPQQSSWFLPLGDLPGGAVLSLAHDVSDDGTVVVGESDSTNGTEAFIWSLEDGMTGLGDLPGGVFRSVATGVSGDGAVVVGYSQSTASEPSADEAFRWTESGGMVGLGSLFGGSFSSAALGASSDGSVIVGWSSSSAGNQEAAYWTSGTGMQGLGDLHGGIFMSRAEDVSADGLAIVGSGANASGVEAFHRPGGGGMAAIGDLPGGLHSSLAHAVSRDGKVAVGFSSSSAGTQAFRWEQDTGMVGLGDLPGGTSNSVANDCSADGSVVVGDGFTENGPEAFVWTEADGMRRLADLLADRNVNDMDGWTETSATGVSADGKIVVGFGTNPSGDAEAFAARLGDAVQVEGPAPLVVTRVKVKLKSDIEDSTLTMSGAFDLTQDVETHHPDITCHLGNEEIELRPLPGDDTLDWGDDDTILSIKADRHGSSRASFRMKRKGDLTSAIPNHGQLDFRLVGGDLDVAGAVQLEGTKFGSGKKPGSLLGPHLALLKGKATLGKKGDTLKLTYTLAGGVSDPPPGLILTFGAAFTEAIPAASFVKKGTKWLYRSKGAGLVKVVLDPVREVVEIKGSGLSLGNFPDGKSEVFLRIGLGGASSEQTVTMVRIGKALRY